MAHPDGKRQKLVEANHEDDRTIHSRCETTTNENVVASKLPKLLTELTGEVPTLSILALMNVDDQTSTDHATTTTTTTATSATATGTTNDAATTTTTTTTTEIPSSSSISVSPHLEDIQQAKKLLFETHAGKYDSLLDTAVRYAKQDFIFEIRKFQDHAFDDTQKWAHQWYPYIQGYKGPKVEVKIWMELFLGQEQSMKLLEGMNPINDVSSNRFSRLGDYSRSAFNLNKTIEQTVHTALLQVKKMPLLQVLTNVLEYLRIKATTMTPSELLRFCVVYGLDGAMNDILCGRYGNAANNNKKEDEKKLTIDTLLPLDDEPISIPTDGHRSFFLSMDRRMHVPPYAMGALLGHTNIVVKALKELGGTLDLPVGVESFCEEENCSKIVMVDNHSLPSILLSWLILTNQQDMVRCLIKDFGFQFRWIDHNGFWDAVQNRLFEVQEYESTIFWLGSDFDVGCLDFAGSRTRCQIRSSVSYAQQMKMLDLLIELGLPFELLFPIEPNIELEIKLREEQKLETEEDFRAFKSMQSKTEWKARNKAWDACCNYNCTQENEEDKLHLHEFYKKLKSRWDKQTSAQPVQLPEFEALDSRWRKQQEQESGDGSGDDDDDNEMDSDGNIFIDDEDDY